MVKNKFIKFVVSALALCLCVCCLIVIGAGASGGKDVEPTPYIFSKNISYSSKVYCFYAVPVASVAEGRTPALDVYSSDGQILRYTVTEYLEENVYGTPCYVFNTNGVSAKNINNIETVVPVALDGAGNKTVGEAASYSVLHYVYERLYKDGFIMMTEEDGEDYLRRTLYLDLMDYGAAAQALLLSDEIANGTVKEIYGDYNYYTVIGGRAHGFCDGGYTLDLAPASSRVAVGKRVVGWTVYSFDVYGNLTGTEVLDAYTSVTVNGIKCIKPISEDVSVLPDDGNTIKFDSISESGFSCVINNECGTATVVDGKDVGREGDNVLLIDKTESGTQKSITTTYSVVSKNPSANVTVFSMDMMFGELERSSSLEISFRSSANTASQYRPVFILLSPSGATEDAPIRYDDYTNGKRNDVALELGINVGEWFNLTVEYYEGDLNSFHFNVYINGELKYVSGAVHGTAFHSGTSLYGAEQIDRCAVYMGWDFLGKFYYDNVRFTQESLSTSDDAHIEDLPAGQTKYDRTVNVMVVSETDKSATSAASEIVNALKNNVTPGAYMGSSSDSKTNEIVVGYVPTKEISVKAYEELAKLSASKSMYTDSRYLIYAEDGKIAVAYDRNTQTNIQSITYAVEKFISEYIEGNTTVTFDKGVIASGAIDLIEKQQILDDARVAAAWKTLKKQCNNDELYEAFVTYYALFKDEMITWMANLYDPGMGCFYSTKSGKESTDIFPNIEATKQILGYGQSSGMTKDIGSQNAFTPLMEYQITYYVKSIQHENGYFYLPQLSKSVIDGNVARLSRDLNWCVQILNEYNVAPTYSAPIATDFPADGKSADEYWDDLVSRGLTTYEDKPIIWTPDAVAYSTDTLSVSVSEAVSKAVLASSVSAVASTGRPDKYSTYEKFEAYLGTLNIDNNPYSDGNELGESTTQIKQYSKDLFNEQGTYNNPSSAYNGMTMAEMLIAYLNSKINDKGLFGKSYLTDNNPNTVGNEFANTNGMMKIMAVYNGLGVAFPSEWAPIAAESLLDAVMRTDQKSTDNICEVYNIWCALSRLKSNVKNCNSNAAVRDSVLAKIEELLNTSGPTAVINAYNAQKAYQKADGTFSHHVVGSSTSYPGPLPMGKGLDEGEIDAIGFGTVSTINMICDVFDLTPVPAYTEADWMHFLSVIETLEPTGKTIDPPPPPPEYDKGPVLEYDDEPDPNIFSYASENSANTVSRVNIAGKDGAADNTALYINKNTTGANVSTSFVAKGVDGATKMVTTTDMMFSGVSGNVEFYIRAGGSSLHCAYIRVSSSGVTIQSNIEKGDRYKIASLGEWFTLSVETTVNATDSAGNPTEMKFVVKVNGEIVYTETEMYKTASPTGISSVDRCVIIFDRGSSYNAYLDNTSVVKEK